MGGKAPPPPDYGPLVEMYKDLGGRYLEQADRQFALEKQRYDELSPYAQQIMRGQINASEQAYAQAREANDFTQNTLRPMQRRIIDDAESFNTDEERERLAALAGADVNQALNAQQGAAMRQLERMGVNPNSGRFMQLMAGGGLNAARMQAAGMNNARTQARNEGNARTMQAYGVASGVPAFGLQAAQVGGGLGGQAANSMNAADRVGQSYAALGMQGMQGYGGTISGAGNMMNQGYQNQMAAYNADNQMMGGVGALLGRVGGAAIPMFMAAGGLVRGPGTGTSDSVAAVNTDNGEPIRLSNGEYVLPERTVRQIGIEKLDKIVERTNGKPPVHKQPNRKAALRRA